MPPEIGFMPRSAPGAPQLVSSFPDVEREPNICSSSAEVAAAAANVAAAVCFTEFLGAVPLEQRGREAEGEEPQWFFKGKLFLPPCCSD